MGIHGLGKFLSQKAPRAVETISADAFMSNVVAIDASTSLYAFMIAIRDSDNFNNLTNSAGESTSHLAGMLTRAIRILELGMKPIYVFDGKAPTLKSGELAKRRDRKAAAQAEMEEARERGDEERIRQLAGRTVRVGKKENDEVKKLLKLMGIPILEAPGEAECQCAYLCRAGVADAVVSEDADALCFGARKLIRGLTFADKNKNMVTCITLDTVLKELELDLKQFIEFCILCGCDYSESLRGVGPHTAFKWIQKHGSLLKTFENNDVDIDLLRKRASEGTVEKQTEGSTSPSAGSGKSNTQPIKDECEPIDRAEDAGEDADERRKVKLEEGSQEEPTEPLACGISCAIDGRQVQIPPNFPFEEAYELFIKPSVIDETILKSMQFDQGDLQETALIEFLVKENQFNETRVTNAIARLKAAKKLGAQTRLDNFFKANPVAAKQPPAKQATSKKRPAPGGGDVKKDAAKKKRKT